MPIKVMADATKEQIREALDDIKLLSREEIADECGISANGVSNWIKTGKIPQHHWEKLNELRITQIRKLDPSLLSEEPIKVKERDISVFSDNELLAELKKRLDGRS